MRQNKKPTTLAAYVKRLRQEQDLTLRDVERISEKALSNVAFNRIERGLIKSPSPATLWTISKVFKCEYLDLMRAAGYLVAPKKKQ